MSDRWSTDDVWALAPDASSRKAALKVAKDGSWPQRGAVAAEAGGTAAVWGECKGSGSKPYLSAVHLDDPAGPGYKCSCPSRKIPCKHVLGLLALWAGGEVADREDRPEWVAKWLGGRAARKERAAGTASKPVDPEKAAATLRKREEAVGAGMDELGLWLRDQIDAGLAEVPKHGYGHWDRMAKRLVDAKAGAAATLVTDMPSEARGDHWPERVLERFALLHLLVEGFRAGDAAGPRVRGAVRARAGITTRVEEVLADGERVRDTWQVLGMSSSFKEQTTTRRVWLRGRRTGRVALSLSHARGEQAPPTPFRSACETDTELAFYPDGHRAAPAEPPEMRPSGPPPGSSVPEALDAFAAALAEDPWLDAWPVVLADAVPARDGGWFLADASGNALPLESGDPWEFLAVTGGRPSTVAAEWSPRTGLSPLTVWDRNGKAVSL
ncbi:hypothetical protein FHS13_003784 [Nocardiopsis algeriensis]|uniref:SWIM-type domain-containing protein n=1 Tax=Nocardiopsis algeriensis TaxID=1478215 RepID=A0A841IZC5_9ACTN|nr:hypothetical protein [Nocardiopsis algeriensis]